MTKNRTIALLIALCLCLSSCTIGGAEGGVSEQGITVVASFYPLYIAALNIIGDCPGVTLTMLAPPDTGCLHDYQLRPQDMAVLTDCDLFVINGAGLETFLNRVLAQRADLPLCVATNGVDLIPYDDHDHDGHDHDHDSEGDNPHAWVSVRNYIRYVENIRDGLLEVDPAHKDEYIRNAERYIETLLALDEDMHDALDQLSHRDIVTFHEAFTYFADEFDLCVAAVIQHEPGQDPSPTELARTIEVVRMTGVTALFAEPQYTPSAARTIAGETGATVYILDPAVTGELTKDAYEVAMRKNMETLSEVLG